VLSVWDPLRHLAAVKHLSGKRCHQSITRLYDFVVIVAQERALPVRGQGGEISITAPPDLIIGQSSEQSLTNKAEPLIFRAREHFHA
jgi:hypothetical protein